jgi:hypothetical protein
MANVFLAVSLVVTPGGIVDGYRRFGGMQPWRVTQRVPLKREYTSRSPNSVTIEATIRENFIIFAYNKYKQDDQIKENNMGRACRLQGKDEKYV